MPFHKRPPRNYNSYDSPIPHEFSGKFQLSCANEAKNSTILPILHTSDIASAADTLLANPQNGAFAEDTGALIHQGSIVPRINFQLWSQVSGPGHDTDKVDNIVFNWMPLYFAFADSYDAADGRTGTDVEAILEMQHQTGQRDGYPLYSGTDLLTAGLHPVSSSYTEVFGDFSLTTDLKLESVAFDANLFWDAMHYYSNRSMLQKVTGTWHSEVINFEHPFVFKSNNFTNPMVKRGNPYTFCGVLIHLPQDDDQAQMVPNASMTDGAHLDFGYRVRYDEWNPEFNQTAQ